MTELFEIRGKWKPGEFDEFVESWQGSLLLEEDGWFEGIIQDRGREDADNFIFGTYKPEEKIVIHKISYYDFRPIIYDATKKDKCYIGTYKEDWAYDTPPEGNTEITTRGIDGVYFLSDAKDLEKRIEAFKEELKYKPRGRRVYDYARSRREEDYRRFKSGKTTVETTQKEPEINEKPLYLQL